MEKDLLIAVDNDCFVKGANTVKMEITLTCNEKEAAVFKGMNAATFAQREIEQNFTFLVCWIQEK